MSDAFMDEMCETVKKHDNALINEENCILFKNISAFNFQ